VELRRSRQFKVWVDALVAKAKSGDASALLMARYAYDELDYLRQLTAPPTEDTATLKQVRQSKRYKVWRLSHPYDEQMALRIICWFDDESDVVVVALYANDKATMGDVFYDSAGTRADQVIDQWRREKEGGDDD